MYLYAYKLLLGKWWWDKIITVQHHQTSTEAIVKSVWIINIENSYLKSLFLKDLSFFYSLDTISQHNLSYSVLPHLSADPFCLFSSHCFSPDYSLSFLLCLPKSIRPNCPPFSTLPPLFLSYTLWLTLSPWLSLWFSLFFSSPLQSQG